MMNRVKDILGLRDKVQSGEASRKPNGEIDLEATLEDLQGGQKNPEVSARDVTQHNPVRFS